MSSAAIGFRWTSCPAPHPRRHSPPPWTQGSRATRSSWLARARRPSRPRSGNRVRPPGACCIRWARSAAQSSSVSVWAISCCTLGPRPLDRCRPAHRRRAGGLHVGGLRVGRPRPPRIGGVRQRSERSCPERRAEPRPAAGAHGTEARSATDPEVTRAIPSVIASRIRQVLVAGRAHFPDQDYGSRAPAHGDRAEADLRRQPGAVGMDAEDVESYAARRLGQRGPGAGCRCAAIGTDHWLGPVDSSKEPQSDPVRAGSPGATSGDVIDPLEVVGSTSGNLKDDYFRCVVGMSATDCVDHS